MIPLYVPESTSGESSRVEDGGDAPPAPRRGRRPVETPVVGSVSNVSYLYENFTPLAFVH